MFLPKPSVAVSWAIGSLNEASLTTYLSYWTLHLSGRSEDHISSFQLKLFFQLPLATYIVIAPRKSSDSTLSPSPATLPPPDPPHGTVNHLTDERQADASAAAGHGRRWHSSSGSLTLSATNPSIITTLIILDSILAENNLLRWSTVANLPGIFRLLCPRIQALADAANQKESTKKMANELLLSGATMSLSTMDHV
ncbi:hypothetical protein BKA70DRAFT_1481850 [Coprinopsis sp. MPI-PUGE-AT-0042]|nr:hypothetical protein BKA70DRAFT_1481850 [Coprinopsis sp. MPI-PUGE-AT-0042]